MMLLRLLSLVLCVLACDLLYPEVYKADDPRPNAHEVLMLEYINRLRMDPRQEAEIIMQRRAAQVVMPKNIDYQMFQAEMRALKPMPPLVFNLDLLKAARWHSYYMICNDLCHIEEKGKKGFTAVDAAARAQLAGYPGPAAENVFRDPFSIEYAHIGLVVDWGTDGGPGGMLKGRGHRASLMGPHREAGTASIQHGDRFSVTQKFSNFSKHKRFVGGVVYIDRNQNQFYDVGEGLAGIRLQSKTHKQQMYTWPHGAYTMVLKNTKKISLSFNCAGLELEKTFKADKANIKFDWCLSADDESTIIEGLLKNIEQSEQKQRLQTVLAMHMLAKQLKLSAEQLQRYQKLTRDIVVPFEQHYKNLEGIWRDGLPQNNSWKTVLDDASKLQKAYAQTVYETWFAGARLALAVKAYESQYETLTASKRKKQLRTLKKDVLNMSDTLWQYRAQDLIKEILAKSHN